MVGQDGLVEQAAGGSSPQSVREYLSNRPATCPILSPVELRSREQSSRQRGEPRMPRLGSYVSSKWSTAATLMDRLTKLTDEARDASE